MNILSIDFDWIMQPTIEAYNNIVLGYNALGPLESWENVKKQIPNFEPYCNLDQFTQLYFLLKDKIQWLTRNDIYIGLNHDELYGFMEKQEAKEYIVYNIDHHHDLGYLESGFNSIIEQPLTLANWAAKSTEKLNLCKYIWISNKNSKIPEIIPENLNYTRVSDISILDRIHIDKIFICSSWEWVPLKYQNLFAILTSLFDDLENK